MLVLGLDTSSPAVSAALVEVDGHGCRTRAEHVVVDGRRHGELLASGVRTVLDGAPATALDAVVVGLGPGPFTGLRVGLVTAAALSDALGVPAYGVCSLDGLVPPGPGDVVVVTDARRREVYWARYAAGERVEGPEVTRPDALAAHLRTLPAAPRLVGAGAVLHRAVLDGAGQDGAVLDGAVLDGAGQELEGGPLHVSVPVLVAAAAARVLARAPSDPLTPLYLRRPDAVEPGARKRVTV